MHLQCIKTSHSIVFKIHDFPTHLNLETNIAISDADLTLIVKISSCLNYKGNDQLQFKQDMTHSQ